MQNFFSLRELSQQSGAPTSLIYKFIADGKIIKHNYAPAGKPYTLTHYGFLKRHMEELNKAKKFEHDNKEKLQIALKRFNSDLSTISGLITASKALKNALDADKLQTALNYTASAAQSMQAAFRIISDTTPPEANPNQPEPPEGNTSGNT